MRVLVGSCKTANLEQPTKRRRVAGTALPRFNAGGLLQKKPTQEQQNNNKQTVATN